MNHMALLDLEQTLSFGVFLRFTTHFVFFYHLIVVGSDLFWHIFLYVLLIMQK